MLQLPMNLCGSSIPCEDSSLTSENVVHTKPTCLGNIFLKTCIFAASCATPLHTAYAVGLVSSFLPQLPPPLQFLNPLATFSHI